jgi:hypothetical protein
VNVAFNRHEWTSGEAKAPQQKNGWAQVKCYTRLSHHTSLEHVTCLTPHPYCQLRLWRVHLRIFAAFGGGIRWGNAVYSGESNRGIDYKLVRGTKCGTGCSGGSGTAEYRMLVMHILPVLIHLHQDDIYKFRPRIGCDIVKVRECSFPTSCSSNNCASTMTTTITSHYNHNHNHHFLFAYTASCREAWLYPCKIKLHLQ